MSFLKRQMIAAMIAQVLTEKSYLDRDPRTKFQGRHSYRPKKANPAGTQPNRGLRRIKGR